MSVDNFLTKVKHKLSFEHGLIVFKININYIKHIINKGMVQF